VPPTPTFLRGWSIIWLPLGFMLLAAMGTGAILIARIVLVLPAMAPFFAAFPGASELPADAPVGFPAWLSWAHFLNAFFLLFIVRSGLQIRSKVRPPAFVTRTLGPTNGASKPRRLSIHVWWHIVVDTLWVLNGVVYVVLLFVSGQWVRVVPTRWDVIPNTISATVQYVAFDWPVHNGWVNYNALQLLSYFATVFIAGPLALLSGLRLSPGWREWRISRVYPEKAARFIHFWVLVYFFAFTVVHVTLVFATGALRNLNHMFADRDDDTWIGALIFAGAVLVMVGGFVLLRPRLQAWIARLGNDVKLMPPVPPIE
jgi:thiosulfate reductase cytochrome b subunit